MTIPMRTSPSDMARAVALGRERQRAGDFSGALAAAQAAVAMDPAHAGAHLLLIECLLHCGAAAAAMGELAILETHAANDARLLQAIAQIYTHTNRHAEAERCCRRAATLEPGNAQYLYNLATAATALGKFAEAEDLLDRVIAAAPTDYDAYYNRATLRTQTPERNHITQIEAALAATQAPGAQVALGYALGKEREDLGDHARAFDAIARAAGARRRQLSYRVDDDVAAMAAIERAFGSAVFAGAVPGHADARPIFILGLPRSGTTLADRILAAHSQVDDLGESSTFAVALLRTAGPGLSKMELIRRAATLDFATLGRAYCGSMPVRDPHLRFIDKTPLNFLYLGLIALALPGARIVHMRRGPMDVCYAMYKTLFRMAYPSSYDLGDLGRYYLAYHRLMEHWRHVLPGRFLDLDYETLVADPEGQSRRLDCALRPRMGGCVPRLRAQRFAVAYGERRAGAPTHLYDFGRRLAAACRCDSHRSRTCSAITASRWSNRDNAPRCGSCCARAVRRTGIGPNTRGADLR